MNSLTSNKMQASAKKRILVADDEQVVLKGLQKGLTKEGYIVDVAKDGIEAVEKLKNEHYDIVLSDLKMPNADGMEVLNMVRDSSNGTLFIMITGYATVENAKEAMKLGAFEYVAKPFTIQEISAIVKRAADSQKVSPKPGKMTNKIVLASEIPALVEHLMENYDVVAPITKGKNAIFEKIENADAVTLNYVSTMLPPKKFLLPMEEELFKFDRETYVTTTDKTKMKPTVLFGIHPYDMQGILRLDQAFTEGFPESNYIERRKKMAIIGVNAKLDDKFFYQEMGASSTKEGYDLFLTRLFDKYLINILTKKGAELLNGFKNIEEATEEEVNEAEELIWKNSKKRVILGCHQSALPELFKLAIEDKVWEELAEKCLSCGACSVVCPTCYCFDVTDKLELNLKNGARYRKWDSCQTEQFAAVGTGENFREHRKERLHHRFAHKFAYFGEKFGANMCVGCGRCTRVCLAGINPAEVIAKLAKNSEMLLMSKVFSYKH